MESNIIEKDDKQADIIANRIRFLIPGWSEKGHILERNFLLFSLRNRRC